MDDMIDWLEKQYCQTNMTVKICEPNPQAVDHLKSTYQIDEESLMGNILLHTGGIVVENWLRIYGSGQYDFATKNEELSEFSSLIVAEDVTGGLFAQQSDGKIRYFSADGLEWEDLDISYNELILFSTSPQRMAMFYSHARWEGWEQDLEQLQPREGIRYYPFLWSKESQDGFSTKIVPMADIFELEKSFL